MTLKEQGQEKVAIQSSNSLCFMRKEDVEKFWLVLNLFFFSFTFQDIQRFYLSTVLLIFIIAMVLQIPSLNVNSNVKLLTFVGWAIYGVLPTFHWSIIMGGMENPIVKMLIPRVLGMYLISGLAFGIYISKMPERLYPGDYFRNIWKNFSFKIFFYTNVCVLYCQDALTLLDHLISGGTHWWY